MLLVNQYRFKELRTMTKNYKLDTLNLTEYEKWELHGKAKEQIFQYHGWMSDAEYQKKINEILDWLHL